MPKKSRIVTGRSRMDGLAFAIFRLEKRVPGGSAVEPVDGGAIVHIRFAIEGENP